MYQPGDIVKYVHQDYREVRFAIISSERKKTKSPHIGDSFYLIIHLNEVHRYYNCILENQIIGKL